MSRFSTPVRPVFVASFNRQSSIIALKDTDSFILNSVYNNIYVCHTCNVSLSLYFRLVLYLQYSSTRDNVFLLSFSFISLTDKVLREISVVEIVGCTLNMCFLGYYTIMVCIAYKKYVPQNASFFPQVVWRIAPPPYMDTFARCFFFFSFCKTKLRALVTLCSFYSGILYVAGMG